MAEPGVGSSADFANDGFSVHAITDPAHIADMLATWGYLSAEKIGLPKLQEPTLRHQRLSKMLHDQAGRCNMCAEASQDPI